MMSGVAEPNGRDAAAGSPKVGDDIELRLIALESRFCHQERMAEEMSDVVARQARTIDGLTAQVRVLQERLAEILAGWPRSPQDESPPPHY